MATATLDKTPKSYEVQENQAFTFAEIVQKVEEFQNQLQSIDYRITNKNFGSKIYQTKETINSKARFIAGAKDDVAIMDAQHPTYRLWIGAADPAIAPFRVDKAGNATLNSVTLSGYLQVGGALTDIGSGNITSTYIANGAITASKISVTTLSAITANLGTVTSGTITGATIQTASSGTRIVMSSSPSNKIQFMNGSTTYGLLEVVQSGTDGQVRLVDPYSGSYGLYLESTIGSGSTTTASLNASNATVSAGGTSSVYSSQLLVNSDYLGVYYTGGTAKIKTTLRVESNWLPYSSSYDLGSSSYRWGTIYANAVSMYGNINPASSGSYYLGTNDFARVYVDAIYQGGAYYLNLTPSVGAQWQKPMGFYVRSGTPGAASSYQGYMYYDTAKANLVFSDGTGWFQLQASPY